MFPAWSFSRYKDHKECPAKAKYKHLDKLPEWADGAKPPAMLRGETIHKEGEAYLRGKALLPASFKAFSREMRELRKAQAIPEGKWGMSIKWTVADFFDWGGCWVWLVPGAPCCQTKK